MSDQYKPDVPAPRSQDDSMHTIAHNQQEMWKIATSASSVLKVTLGIAQMNLEVIAGQLESMRDLAAEILKKMQEDTK